MMIHILLLLSPLQPRSKPVLKQQGLQQSEVRAL